ncbi:MAG TPA: RidA family protein [Casimicrobiaceae bacterium]|nr:RidA family protein [Casimicrobiaceae bacterium]
MNSKRIAWLASTAPSARRFPNAIVVGDTIYVGSEQLGTAIPAAPPDIETQTHEAFSTFVALLEEVGTSMADLVKLHTYYVYDGEADRATAYWQRMTEVRLQYIANPGQAGTALRVKAAPVRGRLIAIDGVASVAPSRVRIMPAHAWDWSMPTPLSQGWRVGPIVYAGGQISADRAGKAVAPGDVVQQAINTMEFLRHVLVDGGASFHDIVALKIAYQHRGDDAIAHRVLDDILGVVKPLLEPSQCTLTCLGVDLLYEGLMLEIDAVAIAGEHETRRIPDDRNACGAPGFASACRVDDLIHVGAIGNPDGSSIDAQLRVSIGELEASVRSLDSTLDDVVKLNVFYVSDDANDTSDCRRLYETLHELLPRPGPVLTLVRLVGLPTRGQRVQIDAIARADAR